MIVIHNGIDTERYRPDEAARLRMRAKWGLRDQVLIGLVGRLDIMKDHPTFLRAAAEIARASRGVRFVCIGAGPEEYRKELEALSMSLGIADQLIWTGELKDMAAAYNALDLLASSSYGEGFPNVIGEAMACGIPCVATDVGDSALIVGNTGTVVPPKDPLSLARAWQQWLSLGADRRRAQGARARERIESNFNVKRMLARTELALKTVTDADRC
jgi:glycosyltransferase involved in cell wall biosynthesis